MAKLRIGRVIGLGDYMTITEALQTIRTYCKKTECVNCQFIDAKWIRFCLLHQEVPEDWDFKIVETNIYDEKEVHENCTVEILRNSVTGEESVRWWENEVKE